MCKSIFWKSVPLALLLVSCSSGSGQGGGAHHELPDSSFSKTPSWVRVIEPASRSTEVPLAESKYAWVPELAQKEAQARLATSPCVPLTKSEAERFGVESLTSGDSTTEVLVLLRGVDLEVRPDDQSLAQNDKLKIRRSATTAEVTLVGARLGVGARSRNRAVIALLPELPAEVYPMTSVVIYGGLSH